MTPARNLGDRAASLRETTGKLLWFAAVAVLLMTLALVVLAGTDVLESPTVQVVLGVLLVVTSLHLWWQHRHRDEVSRDPRLRRGRERRGF